MLKVRIDMNKCLYLWQFLFIASSYKLETRAKPIPAANDTAAVLEVADGETVRIKCPSNDNDHRFMFWHLRDKEILGPGSVINARKYKYEVLTGTLFIKAVSPKEHGIYTCYSSHMLKMTLNAKSVLLVVKSDWQKLWEDDELNFFRMVAIMVIVVVLCVAAYVIRTNMRHHQLMRFKDLTNDESVDEDTPRNRSCDLTGDSRNFEFRDAVDNSTFDTALRFSRESTPPFAYARASNY